MTTHKAIREALEAGPTEGTWSAGIPGGAIISDQHVEHGPNGCDCVRYYGGHLIAESIAKRNLEFIAACNPAAIRALLADLDAKTEALKGLLRGTQEDCGKITMPRDEAVRAAFAALKGTP